MCPFYRQMTVLMDRQPEVKQYTMSLSSLTFSHGDIKKHFVSTILYFIWHNMTTEAGPSLKSSKS